MSTRPSNRELHASRTISPQKPPACCKAACGLSTSGGPLETPSLIIPSVWRITVRCRNPRSFRPGTFMPTAKARRLR